VDPVGGEVGLSQSWNRYAYVLGNPSRYYDTDGRQVAEGIATAAAADPPGAALAAAAVAMDRSLPPELRTSTYALLLISIQTRLGQNIFNGLIQRSKGKSQTPKRDARTRPGPSARPEQSKQDREKNERSRGKREKPPEEASDKGLKDDQPGADKPVPDPDAIPKDATRARKKAIVDLLADVISALTKP
jgi:hypothetical protein